MKKLKKSFRKREENDPLERDLSSLIEKGNWSQVKFELRPKNKLITLRMNEDLLEAIKVKAGAQGIDYQKYIRLVLEDSLKKVS